jgi:hypothetical protein
MSDNDLAADSEDCAGYLLTIRNRSDWTFFDTAVDDYLLKHQDGCATSALRQLLALAFQAGAPGDKDGFHRILGKR